jgi:hypothetical protein
VLKSCEVIPPDSEQSVAIRRLASCDVDLQIHQQTATVRGIEPAGLDRLANGSALSLLTASVSGTAALGFDESRTRRA